MLKPANPLRAKTEPKLGRPGREQSHRGRESDTQAAVQTQSRGTRKTDRAAIQTPAEAAVQQITPRFHSTHT